MRKHSKLFLALAVLLAASVWAQDATYQTLVYIAQGGSQLAIKSGGTLDAYSGSTATFAGTVNASGAVNLSGTTTITGSVVRASQEYILGNDAKVGATAGCAVNAGTNIGRMATCPASQTAATIVVPITGLKVGDTITAFRVVGQIESAGQTVTVDAELRKITAAAADLTDASIGSITQVSVTADAILNSQKTALSEVVAANVRYYILITVTTGSSTDVDLAGAAVTVTGS